MALGGGTWLTQNKKLPGTYINFTSKVRASVNFADRGYAAMPILYNSRSLFSHLSHFFLLFARAIFLIAPIACFNWRFAGQT